MAMSKYNLFFLIPAMLAFPELLFAWQGTSQNQSLETQKGSYSSAHSQKKTKKKEKNDFWNQTQTMRYKLFKEDLADTSRYSNPFITEVPTLKSESIPCSLRPSSGAGFKTNCKF